MDGTILEQTVIGQALNFKAAAELFAEKISSDDFIIPNHKVIARAIIKSKELNLSVIDEDTILLLSQGDVDNDFGGVEYIRALKESFAQESDNYAYFVKLIKTQGIRIALTTVNIPNAIRNLNDTTIDLSEIKKILNDGIERIDRVTHVENNLIAASDLGDQYIVELDDRLKRGFATTGFTNLDQHLTEGFIGKKITILGAFTGMAKSTFAINSALRIANAGHGVAVFSMESTRFSLMDKVISTMTQIPINRLKKESDKLSQDERDRINVAINDIKLLPLLINDQPNLTIDSIRDQIIATNKAGYDLKVVFIDLFGKVDDVDTGDGNLANKIQRECKRMRVIGKSLDIHFVLVVQVGRAGYGKQQGGRLGDSGIKRPSLIHLKNSNAFAEEADLVFLLHRNKYYIPNLQDDILEVIIAKQRDGESNQKVYFELTPETATIISTAKLPHDGG